MFHSSSPSDRKVYSDQNPNSAQEIPVVFVDRSHRLSVDAGAGAGSRWLSAGSYSNVRFRQIEARSAVVTLISVTSEAFDGGNDLTGKTLEEGDSLSGVITSIEFSGGDLICYS
jgi:hypothetical protein